MSNSASLLDLLSPTDTTKEAELNALFDAASPVMLWGRQSSTTTGLTWGYYGGSYATAVGGLVYIPDGALTLAASNTNYIYADPITGAVSSNTAGFPSYCIRLYQVVTVAAAVTSYTDCRSYQPNAIGGTVSEFSNEGSGAQIYDATNSTAQSVLLKELSAASGSAMTVTDSGSTIIFNVAAGSVQSGANEGAGVGILDTSATTASTLQFKKLVQGAGAAITDPGNGTIIIAQQGTIDGIGSNGSVVVANPTVMNLKGNFSVTGSGNTANVTPGNPHGSPDTVPQLSAFTQVNQIGATFTQEPWGIGMSAPSTSNFALAALLKAAPAAPYSVVMRIRGAPFSATYAILAPCWSDGTKYHMFGYFYQGPINYGIGQATNSTSFNNFEGSKTACWGMPEWVRLRDDGTNRYFDVSNDGNAWCNFFSVSRTDYLTPTQVGLAFATQGQALSATLFSWSGV